MSSPWTSSSEDAAERAGPAYQLMGECFLAADRPQDALAAFEKAEQARPTRPCTSSISPASPPNRQAGRGPGRLEAAFADHLAGEGIAPYETLADLLAGSARKMNCLAGSKSSTPPSPTTCRWATPCRPIPGGRQVRQGRGAVLELLKATPCWHTAAWSICTGRPSGSTPCWPSRRGDR